MKFCALLYIKKNYNNNKIFNLGNFYVNLLNQQSSKVKVIYIQADVSSKKISDEFKLADTH